MSFVHGIEVKELDKGTRPIETSKSSVIGLVGTAPKGPVNKPTLIAGSRAEAVKIFGPPGYGYTIPDALDSIFDQIGASVVVVNVHTPKMTTGDFKFKGAVLDLEDLMSHENLIVKSEDSKKTFKEGTDYILNAGIITLTEKSTIAKDAKVKVSYPDVLNFDPLSVSPSLISGGVDAKTGNYTGVQALLASESVVKICPRILVAPGFTGKMSSETKPDPAQKTVVDDLLAVSERLRAVVVIDGPNSNDAAAKNFRANFDNPRLFLVDPYVKVFDAVSQKEIDQPASARVAGIIAKSDTERGFWYSPSNRPMSGITGTVRAVDFTMGDPNARANLLNENHVATIIFQDGYRLWGNRTCCSDKKWMFLSTRRTADMINDALLRAHLWAVDENITKSYTENVVRGVNDFMRYLKSKGAIIGGKCWADPEVNTPDQIQLGRVVFDFDFTPPYPAEQITFRSQLVNNYLTEVI